MREWRSWTRPPPRLAPRLQGARRHLDPVLAAVITAASFTPGLAARGTALGWPEPQRDLDLLSAVLVLAHTLPLLARSRSPGTCLLVVSSAAFVYQSLGYPPTLASVALYLALYGVGAHQVRHRATALAAWGLGYALLALTLVQLGSPVPPVELVEFVALPAGCWLAGAWSRTRLKELTGRQAHELHEAIAEERAVLAGELHDVVTHHVTVMVLQAEALTYLPASDREGMLAGSAAISSAGRRALTDLRDLLQVLHPVPDGTADGSGAMSVTAGPGHHRSAPRSPAVTSIQELVANARLVAQPVTLDLRGRQRPLGSLAGLTVQRIVQEGLTNALKHAPGRATHVQVSFLRDDVVRIDVITAGTLSGDAEQADRTPRQHGRGLAGLRRRVELAGGQLRTERHTDGGFVLSASLPAKERS